MYLYTITDNICELPPHVGIPNNFCDIATRRWSYNHIAGKCGTIVDAGCNRSENNFETESECNEKCGKK